MIIAPDARYGLDTKIYLIQRYIENHISFDCMIYGQLIEQEKQKGRVLEYDEKEPLVDDRKNAVIGFRMLSKGIEDFKGSATVDIICTLETDNREQSEQELFKLIANCGFVNSITGLKLGVNNVFNGLYQDDLKYRDIVPKHVFAFTVELGYEYDICV